MINDLKTKIQELGGFMSGMVMPNIGALIAWGFVTSLFLETGYFPDKTAALLISPTLKYVIPLLFAYTGGFNIYGKRGGVAGCTATVGLIVGSDATMMIGGMVMGPLGACIIKKVDGLFEGKVKPGLEMLVDNFSLGAVGAVMMVAGLKAIQPIFSAVTTFLTLGVNFMITHNILPFTPIFVVPAQILFLNNAINHGIFTPLGVEQAAATGKSIIYLIESCGGAWAGLVLSFCLFGKGNAKKSAPGAAIIQIFGEIGEVAFPYALIKPVTILGVIAGQISSLIWLQGMNGGTVAAVSPGSLIAMIAMSPKGKIWVNLMAYAIGMIVSIVIVSFFLIRDKTPEEFQGTVDEGFNQFVQKYDMPKKQKIDFVPSPVRKEFNKIVFVCDAGMGSSALGASMLKTELNKAGIYTRVEHVSVRHIPIDADLVVVSTNVMDDARKRTPDGVVFIEIQDFLNVDEHKEIAEQIKNYLDCR